MKGKSVLVYLLIIALTIITINFVSADVGSDELNVDMVVGYQNYPLYFISNQGQFEDDIAYEVVGQDSAIFFSPFGVEVLSEGQSEPLQIQFGNATESPPIGENVLNGTANYFLGNDSASYQTDVPLYGSIRYKGLYEGIDLLYSGNDNQLKSEYEIQPGISPDSINLIYKGQESLEIDKGDGSLLITGDGWNLTEAAPYAYQQINGEDVPVESSFIIRSDNTVGFSVGEYDTSFPLIIDPILRYSLFFGGDGVEQGNAIATDDAGYAYLAGSSTSAHMKFSMATNLYEQKQGGERDAFVLKINPDGTELVYITYLGGTGDDLAYGITIDDLGDAYVTGSTNSEDFPIEAAIHNKNAGTTDAFLTKIDTNGKGIDSSTYLGGNGDDIGYDVALDDDGNIFLTGSTTSWDFPIVNKYELSPYSGLEDGFVTKLDPLAESIIYSNYIGGSARDVSKAIVIDPNGYACLAGQTDSPNFPAINAYQPSRKGVTDAFVVKFDPEGTYPAYYSTYLGGTEKDLATDLCVHPDGKLTITGQTFSDDFPTVKAFQQNLNGVSDAFITTLISPGTDLSQSSFLGGSGGDTGNGIARDDDGYIYLIGTTLSTNFPIVKAYQSKYGGGFSDAFVTKLEPDGSSKVYATYLGGYGKDEGNAIAVNFEGDAYLTGYTDSTDFPKVRSYEQSFGDGNYDAFVAVLIDSDKIPITDFYGEPTEGVAPLEVSFYDTTIGIPTSWSWKFGDGATSIEENPVHIYQDPGTYTITLTTTNIVSSDTEEKVDYITVRNPVPLPVADFEGSPRSGSSPLSVTFTDLSTGDPDTFEWSFGDGSNSAEQNPVHVYQNDGVYSVSLTVTNAAGMSTKLEDNYITVKSLPNPPVAAFSANPTSGNAPLAVSFTDLSTGEAISSWEWSFGDGATSTLQNPGHTYLTAGNYDVSLTVTNPGGTDTEIRTEFISVGPEQLAPVADFTGSPTRGEAPLTVSFIDLSLNSPTEWVWDFGDGGTSEEQNPVHVYSEPGTYNVELFVSNLAGMDHKTVTGYITVLPHVEIPDAEFSGSPRSGYAPLFVQFTDQSLGEPVTWSWDFGDGKTSTERNPSHTYDNTGTYTVRLQVTNSAGQSEEIKENYITVEIKPKPLQAAFIGEPTDGNAPLSVRFTDLSTGDPVTWFWDFGDGGTSTERNPSHVYDYSGVFTVRLLVTNNAGESEEIKDGYIVVRTKPNPIKAAFIGEPTSGNAPLSVRFTDLSTGNPDEWLWSFGDEGTSTEKNPMHVYTEPGTYTVYLTAIRGEERSTEILTDYITVYPGGEPPLADFIGTPTAGKVPLHVQFKDLSINEPDSWRWDFGDGKRSEERNPSHTYQVEGLYTVTLTVTNAWGESTEIKREYITAESPGHEPATFYGEITVYGDPGPIGSIIEARAPGVEPGTEGNPITITNPGVYGLTNRLTVSGEIKPGDPITFWVMIPGEQEWVQAECYEIYGTDEGWTTSYPFIPGSDTYLCLRIGESPTPPMPVLPNEFFGDVTYNGAPLVPGSLIIVRGEDVREGVRGNPLLVTQPGKYGVADLQKLVAQGDIEEGTPLSFWIIPAGSAKEIRAECFALEDRHDRDRESQDTENQNADTLDAEHRDKDRDKNIRWTETYPYHEGALTWLNLRAGSSVPVAPVLPATFSGTVTWEGKPLPAGSLVTAEGSGIIGGIDGNPVEIETPGMYGEDLKLTVQGDIAPGTPITFSLYNSETGVVKPAECKNQEFGTGWSMTYPFTSGTDTTLDLRYASGPTPANVEDPIPAGTENQTLAGIE